MFRPACAALAIAAAASTLLSAQRATPRPAAGKVSTTATCAADLGLGVKSHRRFCDVVISRDASAGVVMVIPAHRGPATLRFDLHARFTVPSGDVQPGQAFARHVAVVAVIRPTGVRIDRAAVISEFRNGADLFDQIGGGLAGAKAVAPGPPEAIEITIPAGLSSISIVGVSLEATTRAGRELFDAPGRPVAMVSNWRIEYTPAQ